MTTYNSPFAGDVIQPTDVSYASYDLDTASIQLVWPINGNVSTDVAARIMDIDVNVSSRTLTMPPANQVSVGQDALIRNVGSVSFIVNDFDGNPICTIGVGASKYIYITDNGSEAGTWGVVEFGIGTSAPDAATLQGLGLLAIGSTLNQSHPTSAVTNGYVFTDADRAQTKIWGGGTGAATLPVASSLGDNWFCFFKNNGSGSYTISTSGSDTIDLATDKLFQPNEACIIICTGNEYVTIGYGTSTSFFFTALTKNVTSGNYTLSTSEATTIIQEYVGNLTGNVTVTYPPVVALYVVSNQVTANGHTLTITTGVAGGANAIVPSGNQVTLICDGTNFYNANTVQSGASVSALADGTVSNPSLYFASETNTGLYRPGSGTLGISILGTNRLQVTATGLTINGTGTFSGGISGGTFV